MNAAPAVLLAVASELSAMAKGSLPKMREGETVRREWLKDGVYFRESVIGGEVCQAQYDFRQRKSHHTAARVR